MDANMRDTLESINFIKEHMATKDDVRTIVRAEINNRVQDIVAIELGPIHAELRVTNQRLDALDQHYANLRGVTKEIDELRDRVRAIEKHLGIKKNVTA